MLAPGGGAGGDVHAAAAKGISGSGGALPDQAKIQQSFGGYDISNVQAHTDAAAAQGAAGMGADAYATGNHIAFGKGGASLHTQAHEAAHVVQQQAGVSLAGGVGKAGDAYEQHADRVADAVVQGKSAEGLLDQFTGGEAGGGSSGGQIQRQESKPGDGGALANATTTGGSRPASENDSAEPLGAAAGQETESGNGYVEVRAPQPRIGHKALLDIVDDAGKSPMDASNSLFADLGPRPELPHDHQHRLDTHLMELFASTIRSESATQKVPGASARFQAQAKTILASRDQVRQIGLERILVPNMRLAGLAPGLSQLEESNRYSVALFQQLQPVVGGDISSFLKSPTRGEQLADPNARAAARSDHFKEDAKRGSKHSVEGALKADEGPDVALEAAVRELNSNLLLLHAKSIQLAARFARLDAKATERARDRLAEERDDGLKGLNLLLGMAKTVYALSDADVTGAVLEFVQTIVDSFISDDEITELTKELESKELSINIDEFSALSHERNAARESAEATRATVTAAVEDAARRHANISTNKQERRAAMASIGNAAIPDNRGQDAEYSAKLSLTGAILEMAAS